MNRHAKGRMRGLRGERGMVGLHNRFSAAAATGKRERGFSRGRGLSYRRLHPRRERFLSFFFASFGARCTRGFVDSRRTRSPATPTPAGRRRVIRAHVLTLCLFLVVVACVGSSHTGERHEVRELVRGNIHTHALLRYRSLSPLVSASHHLSSRDCVACSRPSVTQRRKQAVN